MEYVNVFLVFIPHRYLPDELYFVASTGYLELLISRKIALGAENTIPPADTCEE